MGDAVGGLLMPRTGGGEGCRRKANAVRSMWRPLVAAQRRTTVCGPVLDLCSAGQGVTISTGFPKQH